ncbi:hypothetical protein F886_00092 [Acinetobacter sp. NIPH 542]|uniref:hypothetical protein n=1 Tax=Acinetobacter sp. NIPH 542 TaxID=1217688 RepID=UPI0002D0A043|nr:hypothetical protein [Acinetobacter sp. NIPH 542]ENX48291.1 hypothetical protein F886_00092 [Acinetobacter sp. NIPH 542]
MTDLNNPETIEIHGLRTIHKLCKFGADNNLEGCTFTEIVDRLFVELEKAKAQAVPEGYVLMPKVPTEKMFQAYACYSVAPMSTLSKTGYKAMVEASESGAEG